MKACPYCLEEIRDGAVKCRYCGSLLSGRSTGDSAKASDPGRILYSVDREFVRFVKYAVWCLLALITLTAILYVVGFHFGKFPLKPEQVTYTFVIDGELYRFVKVAGAILGIFVTVGVFLYGFEIKKAAKEARDSAESSRKARFDAAQIKSDMQADQNEAKGLLEQAKTQIASSKDEINKIAAQVAADQERSHSILIEVQKAQENIEQSRGQAEASAAEARTSAEQAQVLLETAKKSATAIDEIRNQLQRGGTTEVISNVIRRKKEKEELSYNVRQLMGFYSFPEQFKGEGQCIGLIELGGGYLQSDLEMYFGSLKIKTPDVVFVSVDGARNQPNDSAAGQTTLDLEVAGAVAPKAKLVVYMAPNTTAGFVEAIKTASSDEKNRPSVLSISWGITESNWTAEALKALDDALHFAAMQDITIMCACGDNGATDGMNDGELHVDFPASSPWVLACGGTRLTRSGEGILRETVWNEGSGTATGGGVSRVFPAPSWQSRIHVPSSPDHKTGRAIPDVAAHASVHPGYEVVFHGNKTFLGGTSASTPLWAGLIALLNQALGRNVGYINPLLYEELGPLGVLRDITEGDNGVPGVEGYSARTGWDPCTGWGSPDGGKLLEALKAHLPPARQ
ncbi:MAG TPA: S8 family serine peptidase [Terracidiphilus sp.]|jgi:uncharacterized membrane protein